MMRHVCLAVLALSGATAAWAENWPQWRGPFFNGATTEQGLPGAWSKTEGIAWAAPLPGFSGATPAIWEDAVFVTSPDGEKHLRLICLDRKTGRPRWEKVVAAGDREHGRNNAASPSPVTDGRSVFAMFATGDLAAFDFSGLERWRRNLAQEYGSFAIMWMYGSSPMLYAGRLYVQVLQRAVRPDDYDHAPGDHATGESFLLCLDPETGRDLWRHVRATDAAAESQEAYSTPIPSPGAAGGEILVAGADYVTAHSATTGAELWRCGGLNPRGEKAWRLVPSPVAVDGMVIACGPRGDPVLGLRDGGTGLVTGTHLAWKFKEFPADCPTPLAYEHRLFILDGDHQAMTCLNPATGEKQWQGNLGVHEIFRASPTGADGKIYCLSESGTVVVLEGGERFQIRATIPMGEGPVRSSIAVARGHLFIRTAQHLYCVGEP